MGYGRIITCILKIKAEDTTETWIPFAFSQMSGVNSSSCEKPKPKLPAANFPKLQCFNIRGEKKAASTLSWKHDSSAPCELELTLDVHFFHAPGHWYLTWQSECFWLWTNLFLSLTVFTSTFFNLSSWPWHQLFIAVAAGAWKHTKNLQKLDILLPNASFPDPLRTPFFVIDHLSSAATHQHVRALQARRQPWIMQFSTS